MISSLPSELYPLITEARNLPFDRIIELCRVDKKFNTALCNNIGFWRQLARDRTMQDDDFILSQSLLELKHGIQAVEKLQRAFTHGASGRIGQLQVFHRPVIGTIIRQVEYLTERGYNNFILSFWETYRNRRQFSRVIGDAIIHSGTLSYQDDLVQQILDSVSPDIRLKLVEELFKSAVEAGRADLVRQYWNDVSGTVKYDVVRQVFNMSKSNDSVADVYMELYDNPYDLLQGIMQNTRSDYLDRLLPRIPSLGKALINAVNEGKHDYVEYFLSHITNKNDVLIPLTLAIQKSHREIIEHLAKYVTDRPDIIDKAAMRVLNQVDAFPNVIPGLHMILPFLSPRTKKLVLDKLQVAS